MRINGLRSQVVGAVNAAVAPLGGYVKKGSVEDTSPNEGEENISLTVAFTEESLRVLRIAQSVLQARDNLCTPRCCSDLRCPCGGRA